MRNEGPKSYLNFPADNEDIRNANESENAANFQFIELPKNRSSKYVGVSALETKWMAEILNNEVNRLN